MKKKRIIRLLAAVMLLTVLLSGCGTAGSTDADNQTGEAQTQMPAQPPEISAGQQMEMTVTVYPVDLRFAECAVLDIPQEPEPAEIPQETQAASEPRIVVNQNDEKPIIGGIDGVLGGSQEPEEQPKDTYTVFRYLEPQSSAYRIQLRKQEEWTVLTGTLTPGEEVQWDASEAALEPEREKLSRALLEDLQWIPCTEAKTYAVNTSLTRCLVSGRNVFYSDDTSTILQVQSYDASGVLTGVVPLAQEDGILLWEGALSQMLWDSNCFPELQSETQEESPAPAASEDPAVQKLLADYEAQLQGLRQKNEQSKITVIVVGAVAALLVITNLICLLRGSRRKARRPDKAKTSAAAPDSGSASSVKSFGVVHNIGRRSGQQDSFDVIDCAAGTLAVVADGMGGLADGDKVSQKIIATMRADSARLRPGSTDGVLHQLIAHVNQEVNRMLGTANQYKCGSTLLSVLVEKGTMQWATVGDSRIYLYRGGSLLQVNREHIYKADLLERAINGKMSFAEVMRDPQADRLSSFIGMGELRHVDSCLSRVKVLKGDRILMMSDGVFNTLSNDEIAEVIQNAPSTAEAAQQLEQRVLQKQVPNQDNFTCIILEV